MIERTKAIVLNQIKYSDSSIIVNLLSLKFGRISVIVKSCRSKKSLNKASLFFPLNIIEADIYYKQNRSVQILKNAGTAYVLNSISTNIYKTCIAQFIAEILQKSIKEEAENSETFNFIESAIIELEKSCQATNNFHIIFLIHLAKNLGFKINNNHCDQTRFFNIREGMFLPFFTSETESMQEQISASFSDALSMEMDNYSELFISYKTRQEILKNLIQYYKYHIINNEEVKSVAVLNSVFEN